MYDLQLKLERLGGQGKQRYSHGVRDYDTRNNEPTWKNISFR